MIKLGAEGTNDIRNLANELENALKALLEGDGGKKSPSDGDPVTQEKSSDSGDKPDSDPVTQLEESSYLAIGKSDEPKQTDGISSHQEILPN